MPASDAFLARFTSNEALPQTGKISLYLVNWICFLERLLHFHPQARKGRQIFSPTPVEDPPWRDALRFLQGKGGVAGSDEPEPETVTTRASQSGIH